MIPPYPLAWPEGFPRTPPHSRRASQFKTTLAGAIANVSGSLRAFGKDSGKAVTEIVATSNTGGIVLGEAQGDPGVAVWFDWDGQKRCIAVDRYLKPQENLQAIHHILEARRTEVRHGGIVIARTAFKGFLALPAPPGSHWTDVLGIKPGATADEIERAWKMKALEAHPDRGGSDSAMARVNAARDRAIAERSAQ